MHAKQGGQGTRAAAGSKRHQQCCAHIRVRRLWVSASLQVYATVVAADLAL